LDKNLIALDISAPVQQILAGENVLYLAIRSAPFVIKISMFDGRQLMPYVGHTETSFSILLYEDLLLSGSADYSILCWKENSGQLVQSFLGHSNLVFVVAVYDGYLYSAGTEAIIIKWNLNDGQILKKFPELHADAISCFAHSSQKLYTGSFDSSIVVWNLTSAEPTNSFKGKVNNLNAVAIWKNFIFGAGSDGQIRLWNQLSESTEVYSTLNSSINKVFCLHVHEDILYSGSSDQTILRWNLATLSLLESLESKLR
jgi:WD40 repeat protein